MTWLFAYNSVNYISFKWQAQEIKSWNVFLQSGLETLFLLGLCDILMLGTKSHKLNLLTRIDIDFCQTGRDFIYSSSVKLGISAIFTFSILSKISDKPYTQAYQSH